MAAFTPTDAGTAVPATARPPTTRPSQPAGVAIIKKPKIVRPPFISMIQDRHSKQNYLIQ